MLKGTYFCREWSDLTEHVQILCLSSLPARVFIQSVQKPYAAFPHPNIRMLHIKFDQDWPTGLRDIQVSSEKL